MLELYTISARQAVYFARIAAEGSKRIEVDHLLSGIGNVESWFAEFAAPSLVPKAGSRDMALSFASKRVLAYAAEEGVRPHGEINCLHLALGILREGKSEAARRLVDRGFTREKILLLLPPARPLPPAPWILATQHVVLFLLGFTIWLCAVGFGASALSQRPAEERGELLIRLHARVALPLFAVAVTWLLAIGLSLLGFGFRSGGARFTTRSRVLVPLACLAVYLFHRFVLLPLA
jgi:hypothetical protein